MIVLRVHGDRQLKADQVYLVLLHHAVKDCAERDLVIFGTVLQSKMDKRVDGQLEHF